METNILKNTGRIILSLFFVFICSMLYAVEIETSLSPSKIAMGESAQLKIKITGKSSDVKPVKFPAINGLTISFSGSSRSFQFINGKSWSGTVLSFSIYGGKTGDYKIPPFILEADGERIASREVSLTVGNAPAGRGGSGGPLRGDVELSSETVYIGEPVIMRYFIYNSDENEAQIEGFSEQPHTRGFVMKGIDEKLSESGKESAGSFCLVPVDKGIHNIGGGSVQVIVEMSQGFFSMNGRKRIIFPEKKITVTPIPANGKPDGFTGDVGEFKIEAQIPKGKFDLFEEIKIPVKITGRGNLLTLSKPLIENQDGIKTVIEEKEQSLSITGKDLSGTKNFLITIIPQKEGSINPGRISIEYFNPYKKVYEKTESQPLAFEVQKGDMAGTKGEVQFSSDGSTGNKFNYIYAALILAGLSVSVIMLVMWERKKLKIIRAELGTDAPVEAEAPVVNFKDEILHNIQTSIKEKNIEMFLSNADRGINRIEAGRLAEVELDKYNHFKEKIYFCRYGGGVFGEAEMNEFGQWLKRNLK